MRSLFLATALLSGVGCSYQRNAGIHAKMAWSEERGLRVIEAPSGGPASAAGLRPGDYITTIDGRHVREMSMKDVVKRLRGRQGSKVRLLVNRGSRTYQVEVEREYYQRP